MVSQNPGAGAGCEGEDVAQISALGPVQGMTTHMYWRWVVRVSPGFVMGRQGKKRVEPGTSWMEAQPSFRVTLTGPARNPGGLLATHLHMLQRFSVVGSQHSTVGCKQGAALCGSAGLSSPSPRHMEQMESSGWQKPGFEVYVNYLDR